MSVKFGYVAKQYLTGKLKCAEFAVTNTCIARCTFCNIWKQKPKVFVDRDKSLATIDRMADFGVCHVTLTGGEPLLHPDIYAFAERCATRGVHNCVLVAAPQLLLKHDSPKRLEAAGTNMVSISFDSGDPEVMAKSRGIDGIMNQMKEAMDCISKTSLKTMASVLIWNDNYDRLEDVCKQAIGMGFDNISFNYPTFSESDVYELGGCGINLSRDKIIQGLESAISLKQSGRYRIINPVESMRNIIQYLKDPSKVKFPCFGGHRVLFVDWFLNVHPCMQLPDILGQMPEMKEDALRRPACNQCNMSWYRDFSLYFNGLRSVPALLGVMKDAGAVV